MERRKSTGIEVSKKVFIIGLIGVLHLFSDPTEIGRPFDWKAQIVGAVLLGVAWLIHYLETHYEEE